MKWLVMRRRWQLAALSGANWWQMSALGCRRSRANYFRLPFYGSREWWSARGGAASGRAPVGGPAGSARGTGDARGCPWRKKSARRCGGAGTVVDVLDGRLGGLTGALADSRLYLGSGRLQAGDVLRRAPRASPAGEKRAPAALLWSRLDGAKSIRTSSSGSLALGGSRAARCFWQLQGEPLADRRASVDINRPAPGRAFHGGANGEPPLERGAHHWGAPERAADIRAAGPRLRLGAHVRRALANDEPVVALESTLITHGLPEPENLALALELESEVRGETRGATPATVGLVRGEPIVGLSGQEIEYLARRGASNPIKASRRDLGVALALGRSAGTTVAGTLALVCALPGAPIKVFATGGTGGVHAGGALSMDVSADLYELARSPVGVVSAGFKSFLDTRLSLELLETFGCTVMSLPLGWRLDAQTNTEPRDAARISQPTTTFPGFLTLANRQGVASPLVVDSVRQASRILYQCLEAPGLAALERRGALLAVPIAPELALDEAFAGAAIDEVSAEIDGRQDLAGKDKTPLILERLARLTGGRSLAANMGLLKNNARAGARLAIDYALERNRTGAILPSAAGQKPAEKEKEEHEASRVVVLGCTMIDMHVSLPVDEQFQNNPAGSGITFEGEPHLTLGGVGRNLATALDYLGHEPLFITSLARDNLGSFALAEFGRQTKAFALANTDRRREAARPEEWATPEGTQTGRLRVAWPAAQLAASSCFALVLMDSIRGHCEYVVANLKAMQAIDGPFLKANEPLMRRAPMLVMDANLPADAIEKAVHLCHTHRVPIFVEPTDVLVLPRLVDCLKRLARQDEARLAGTIACLSPNLIEFQHIEALFEERLPGQQVSEAANQQHADQSSPLMAVAGERQPAREPGADAEARSLASVEKSVRHLMNAHLIHLRCLLVTMDTRGVLLAVRVPQNRFQAEPTIGDPPNLDELKLMELLRSDGPEEATSTLRSQPLLIRHFPVPQLIERPISASGAGDSFAAGFISGLLNNLTLAETLERAFEASRFALLDRDTIPKRLKSLAGPRTRPRL